MEKPIEILIAGDIGSGKTTFAGYLTELYKIPVFNSDKEAKKIYRDQKILANINEIVGGGIIKEDGTLNNMALATIIFNDDLKRQKLEMIIHPKVRDQFEIWKKEQNSLIVAKESAIALKNGRDGVDFVIIVEASEPIRIERVMNRDHTTRENVLARIQSQSINYYSLADFIISNESDLLSLKNSVDNVINEISKRIDYSI